MLKSTKPSYCATCMVVSYCYYYLQKVNPKTKLLKFYNHYWNLSEKFRSEHCDLPYLTSDGANGIVFVQLM